METTDTTRDDRAVEALRINIAGAKSLDLDLARTAQSPGDNRVCQKEIGEGWQAFLGRVFRSASVELADGDTVMSVGAYELTVLWWMARRKNGEPGLRYMAHEAEVEARVTDGTFTWDQFSLEPVYGDAPAEDEEPGEE